MVFVAHSMERLDLIVAEEHGRCPSIPFKAMGFPGHCWTISGVHRPCNPQKVCRSGLRCSLESLRSVFPNICHVCANAFLSNGKADLRSYEAPMAFPKTCGPEKTLHSINRLDSYEEYVWKKWSAIFNSFSRQALHKAAVPCQASSKPFSPQHPERPR